MFIALLRALLTITSIGKKSIHSKKLRPLKIKQQKHLQECGNTVQNFICQHILCEKGKVGYALGGY